MRKTAALALPIALLLSTLPATALAEGEASSAPAQTPSADTSGYTPLFSGGGQTVRAEVGLGATYALIGINLEYAPFPYGSIFVGFTGVQDAFFGVTGGLRVYPLGNDNDVNVYAHGFAGFIGLAASSDDWGEDSIYGISYYGAGGGLEFRFDSNYHLRLGVDWVHAVDEDLALPLIGVSKDF